MRVSVEFFGRLFSRHMKICGLFGALPGFDMNGFEVFTAHDRAETAPRRRPAVIVDDGGNGDQIFPGRANTGYPTGTG